MSKSGSGYTARAAVTVDRDAGGRMRVTRLRSDGPLAVRMAGDPDRPVVYLVGAAAGPLGGDDVMLEITVGPGARLAVRSAATTLAMPGDGESRLVTRATVGAAGRLDFGPEPTVAVAGCRHRSVADVALGPGAVLRWREELVLGRYGEPPGAYSGRLDVTLDGVALLRHELRVHDPATYGSGAVLAGAGAAGAVVLTGPDLARKPYTDDDVAVLPLTGSGVLVSATAANAPGLRRRLDLGERAATSTAEQPGGRSESDPRLRPGRPPTRRRLPVTSPLPP
jgi:urease accessory protein